MAGSDDKCVGSGNLGFDAANARRKATIGGKGNNNGERVSSLDERNPAQFDKAPPSARSGAKRSEHGFGRGPRARNEVSTRGRHANPTRWGHQSCIILDLGQVSGAALINEPDEYWPHSEQGKRALGILSSLGASTRTTPVPDENEKSIPMSSGVRATESGVPSGTAVDGEIEIVEKAAG